MGTRWIEVATQRHNDTHIAAASGTGARADFGFWRGVPVNWRLGPLWLILEKRTTETEFGGAVTIGHKAKVTDAVEPVRQGVQQKATDELVGRELHDFSGAVLAIILPSESDMIVVEGFDAAIGDGDAVRITTEIGENLGGSAERLLCIDDPVGAAHIGDKGEKVLRIGEVCEVAEKSQGAGVISLL